jgi:hypothetical protein
MSRDAELKVIVRMTIAWWSETEGALCESVEGEDGELSGNVVHAVVGPINEIISWSVPASECHNNLNKGHSQHVWGTWGTWIKGINTPSSSRHPLLPNIMGPTNLALSIDSNIRRYALSIYPCTRIRLNKRL